MPRAVRSVVSRSSITLYSSSNARDLLDEMNRSELRPGQHRIGADVQVVAVLRLVVPLQRWVQVPVLRKRGDVDVLGNLLPLERLHGRLDAHLRVGGRELQHRRLDVVLDREAKRAVRRGRT